MLSSTRVRQKGTAMRPPGPRQRRTGGWPPGVDWQLWTAIALLVVAFLLALGWIVYPRVWIVPGVRSLGVDLGGKTRAQATSALQENWQARTILLLDASSGEPDASSGSAGATSWATDPVALGLVLDFEATVQAAFVRGRSTEKLGSRLRGVQHLEVLPVLRLEASKAEQTFRALRSQIDLPPQNTSLQRVDGRVVATEPRPGRSFDWIETLARLQEHPLAVIAAGRLDLIVHPVPPLAIDVSDAVARANEWLARTLSVVAYDPIADETLTWTMAPDRWAAWVSLDVDPGDPTRLRWTLDRRAARTAWDAWEASLGAHRTVDGEQALLAIEKAIMEDGPRARLRVYHSPSVYTVQLGDTLSSIARQVGIPYPWIEQANPGVSDSLRVGQVLAIPSPDVLLPLPVVEHKRIVVSLSRQRMWAYENGALLWEWPVSTGIPSSPTAPGVFQVQSHDLNAYAASWDLWMPYFVGIYRPVPTSNFMNGFHGFPTRDGVTLLWTGNLGYPVTYGCILLGNEAAPLLYQWAEQGVIVEIRE